ncbi:DUF6629 family protein [Daejeonella oryzae]|uniref:DUF6629 family protein n=1 Tax=Daejeonella oryzae TaxID=1122943 RepID=UPI00041FB134|nr:DUF6629 family protein [Daejeonella oryzae]
MCFSASVSFGAGAVLSIIGIATVRKAETSPQFMLAVFPFFFALQQIAEGFVWLSFVSLSFAGWQSIPINFFLSFSHIIWPIWIPLCMLLLEERSRQRSILYILLAAGIILGIYHIFCMLLYPIITRIDGHHVQYIIADQGYLRLPANILYGLSTILPFFISSVKRMWWMGVFILVSYIFTYLIYNAYITSVWCFFATILSVIVYYILNRQNLRRHDPLISNFKN